MKFNILLYGLLLMIATSVMSCRKQLDFIKFVRQVDYRKIDSFYIRQPTKYLVNYTLKDKL